MLGIVDAGLRLGCFSRGDLRGRLQGGRQGCVHLPRVPGPPSAVGRRRRWERVNRADAGGLAARGAIACSFLFPALL